MKTACKRMRIELPIGAGLPVRKCVDCGGQMTGKHQSYNYVECGLSSVELLNVLVYHCASCGAQVPEIPAIEILHTFIAIDLLQKESLLSGEEIRFLRKMSGLNQAELAEILGVDKTRPSKWESGGQDIGKETDRVLRSCCLFGMVQQLLNSDDPVNTTRSAAKVIRGLDVRDIFKKIAASVEGSKPVTVESTGDIPEPWLLPQERARVLTQ
jgi:putative zinc finger/helix-turn-helix YgiT family protein